MSSRIVESRWMLALGGLALLLVSTVTGCGGGEVQRLGCRAGRGLNGRGEGRSQWRIAWNHYVRFRQLTAGPDGVRISPGGVGEDREAVSPDSQTAVVKTTDACASWHCMAVTTRGLDPVHRSEVFH